jgi:hypothetical protein
MPEIIITAAGVPTPERGERDVLLRERVNCADFESERFAANLLERLEWAVADATEVERRGRITGRVMPAPRPALENTPERSPEPVGAA